MPILVQSCNRKGEGFATDVTDDYSCILLIEIPGSENSRTPIEVGSIVELTRVLFMRMQGTTNGCWALKAIKLI